jgi:hypothetical protein
VCSLLPTLIVTVLSHREGARVRRSRHHRGRLYRKSGAHEVAVRKCPIVRQEAVK